MKKKTTPFLSRLMSWRDAFAFVIAALVVVPVFASAAPASVGVKSESGADKISITYTFPEPSVVAGKDGLSAVAIPGFEPAGDSGAPALPFMQAGAAIPEGKAVKSVTFIPGNLKLFATGVNVRHMQRPVPTSAIPVDTPRNEAIYTSSDPYPASPLGKSSVQWKRGVGIHVASVCPVVYIPSAGRLSWYETLTIEIELENEVKASSSTPATRRLRARSSGDISAAAFLVDNPADVKAKFSASARSARLLPTASDDTGDDTPDAPIIFNPPKLPCTEPDAEFPNGYNHVIITTEELQPAFAALARYRRSMGTSSTVVTIEDISSTYIGSDAQERIREFIIDAYENWGTEYVVLGGDVAQVPARMLWVEAWAGGDVDTMPSDLYYQCLDGDFDGNGNGIFGEPGDDVDLFAEVFIGRVSAETPTEVYNWLEKAKRYDSDCVAKADYTRAAGFVGEYMGPNSSCYGKPLMELIRQGTKYTGNDGGLTTFGFGDAPDLFDDDKAVTLYEADGTWDAPKMMALINSDSVSVINHKGHSDYNYNMKLSTEQADSLVNKNPFFCYSQGCIAGAIDKDCIAEHLTTSGDYGCFAGVWNARYGWYSYSAAGVSQVGPSQRYHRWFWHSVFADKAMELGVANALSHERNAAVIDNECMRWCYYETNLLGDPMQSICGPASSLEFDREAYKSTADAGISYKAAGLETNEVDTVLFLIPSNTTDAVKLCDVKLYRVESGDDQVIFTNSVSILAQSGEYKSRSVKAKHGDQIRIELADGSRWDIADIDDVLPQIFNVSLRNPDVDMVTATWETDEPADSAFVIGPSIPLSSENAISVTDSEYRLTHSAEMEGLAPGIYFVRIIVSDKAGNTNAIPVAADSTVEGEYPRVIVATRRVCASYDMENDASAWSVSPASSATYTNCWELGTPTYGPDNASRCWGTVIGGRYLSGANDSLVSPPITLSACSTVAFRHWYEIEETPLGGSNLVGADFGTVEAMVVGSGDSNASGEAVDGSWHNVMQFARVSREPLVSGSSEGVWESVRILLPEEYENKVVRFRFRFVSDTYKSGRANPAGWYVDTVSFEDLPAGGVTLDVAEIDDSVGGNGDGRLQPGETAKIKLSTANLSFDDVVVPEGKGSVAIAAGGDASGKITLVGGSPVAISYPALKPGVPTAANNYIEIAVADDVPLGTPITLTQTVVDQSGRTIVASKSIVLTVIGSVEGRVVQPTGSPVCNALVQVKTSDADYECKTDETGSFSLDGVSPDRKVLLTASYGYAKVGKYVTTPADDVELELPLAEIGLSESGFELQAESTDSPSRISFAITNFFTQASADGNIGPSCDLEYEIIGLEDDEGAPLEWLKLVSEAKGSVSPNGSVDVELEIDPSAVSSGGKKSATLEIFSNAWNDEVKAVDISLLVTAVPVLVEDGYDAVDFFYDIPHDESGEPLPYEFDNDYDEYLESGEFGIVEFAIKNGGESAVKSFEGTVEVTTGNAEIITDPPAANYPDGDIVSWGQILPSQSVYCDYPIAVMWNAEPGTPVVFHVNGIAVFDGGQQELDFYYEIETPVNDFITGKFVKVNLFPQQPVGATNPVSRVTVYATDENCNVAISSPSTTNGSYSITGLAPDMKYWISYELYKTDKETVLPPAFLLKPENVENLSANPGNGRTIALPICGTTYGKNAPHFALDEYWLSNNTSDNGINPGDTVSIEVRLENDGTVSANNLTARLYAPEEFELPQCMEVVSGTGIADTDTVEAGHDFVITNLAVRVFDGAADGSYQRFMLELTQASDGGEDKVWYFDIAVPVMSAVSVSGEVKLQDGSAFSGVVVSLENEDTGARRSVTLSGEGSCEYEFDDVGSGEYTVSVSGIPAGYLCKVPSVDVSVAAANVEGVDFLVIPWGIEPTSDLIDPETGVMEIEIYEGESLTNVLKVANSDEDATDVKVAISYVRKQADVLTRDQLKEEHVAFTRAATLARAGNDWTKLDRSLFNPNELEVIFKEGTPVAARDAYLARHGFKASYHFKTFAGSIAVPAQGAAAAALAAEALAAPATFTAAAADDEIVEYVQPSAVCHLVEHVPNDSLYPRQWALNNVRQTGGTKGADIGAEAAWDLGGTTGSPDVRVAVTDTGVDFTHPDLAANVIGGWNYVYDNSAYGDQKGHGTHVAGIIGAVGDNGIGISGVNGKIGIVSSRICAKDIFGNDVWASTAMIAIALEESFTVYGCRVNNNSWAGPLRSEAIYQVMKAGSTYRNAAGENADVLFVAAAGNEGLDNDITLTYPACLSAELDNIIVVAAADHDDNIAYFSNYSPKLVHLAAPGVKVLSTYIDKAHGNAGEDLASEAGYGNYVEMNGTSMASPYVAGAAAYLWAVSPAASYSVIRDAILGGVRKDPDWADKVSTSGLLDLATSVRLLGRTWLRFADEGSDALVVTNVTIAGGGYVDLAMLVNAPADLLTGEYEAEISVSDASGSERKIPVHLIVDPAAVATLKSAEVTAEQWPDGISECGEEAELTIVVDNTGSSEFDELSAELVAENGGAVLSSVWPSDYVAGLHASDPGIFQVRFPTGVESAEFTLVLRNAGEIVAEIPVSIPLFDGTMLKVVVTDGAKPVPGAVAELYGGSAASAFTDAEGVAYLPVRAGATDVTLRVIADGCVRYVEDNVATSGTRNVALGHASLSVGTSELNLSVTEGKSVSAAFSVTVGSGVAAKLRLAPRAKIAVFDDLDNSSGLVAALRQMGFEVDYYPNNFKIVTVTYGGRLEGETIHMVVNSWDDALVLKYDGVISVLSGTDGSGRLLGESEAKAFKSLVERGGRVVFTGSSPLSKPDNLALADIMGLGNDACDNMEVADAVATFAGWNFVEQPFVGLDTDAVFATDGGLYDAVYSGIGGTVVATASAYGDPLAKIYASERSASGGVAVLWDGNVTDWAHEGAALDLLRDFLYNEFIAQQAVPWLSLEGVSPSEVSSGTITVTANADRTLGVGEYSASALLLANIDGEECVPVVVNLSVVPPTVRAHNLSGRTVDFGGRPLQGNGAAGSCLFQMIWAGPDGVIDPPDEDGNVTGDDVILEASGTGNPFAYFGCGGNVLADSGNFDAEFNLSFAGYDSAAVNKLYVRAWDASSAKAASAYGNSKLVEVTYTEGEIDDMDFGSWIVGTAFCDVLDDSDGDTIPDAWIIERRPDLDPRSPVEPLGTEVTNGEDDFFETAVAPANYNADGNPARVFVAGDYVYVLEQWTHRIVVHDRAAPYAIVAMYGKNGGSGEYGNGNGEFNRPFGMALDTISGKNRFAVADTGNNRVQLFEFEGPNITFVASYGTATPNNAIGISASTATLAGPCAVAFMKGGDLLVADTGNFRVLRLKTTNKTLAFDAKFDFDADMTRIQGICYDKDNLEGFWVADSFGGKQRISFHHTANFNKNPVVSFGGNGEFTSPRDVQVWTVGNRKRICAVDNQGSRVRVFNCLANARGAYTNIEFVVDVGSASDASLEPYQKLWLPNGVFPVNGTNLLYVADYGHNKIKWYGLAMDADMDGMDDIWEDMHGLDSTVDDAMDDADGDGLANVGEFRAGTDPQNEDSDGDGVGDLTEMYNLRDPLDAGEPPFDADEVVKVETFNGEGDAAVEFEVGETVEIKATFAEAIAGECRIALYNAAGICVADDEMAASGTEATFFYTAKDTDVGLFDVRFTFSKCDPANISTNGLFEVRSSGEVYEEVPWTISAISLDETAEPSVKLTWGFPADHVPAAVACIFRVEFATELGGAWDSKTIPAIEATDASGCEAVVPFSTLGATSKCFFRLYWTNKVADGE